MTAFLPAEVQAVFDRFVTAEFTVVTRRGQPITWPVTPYYRPGDECIDVTTGLGYPKKADAARANPQVALLFSDPTGSAIDEAPAVLVQGTASVDDADLEANRARYERESVEKLPGLRALQPPRGLRPLLSWYYTRIYVHVRPERVFVWAGADPTLEPQLYDSHMEEVRSGHDEASHSSSAASTAGPQAWDKRVEDLGTAHKSAVLSVIAPDGFPFSVRVAVHADRNAGKVRVDDRSIAAYLQPGRACLCAHEHDPDFRWQRNFQVRGELTADESGWSLVPHKVVGGLEPGSTTRLGAYSRNLKKAARFWLTARREQRRRTR